MVWVPLTGGVCIVAAKRTVVQKEGVGVGEMFGGNLMCKTVSIAGFGTLVLYPGGPGGVGFAPA